MEVAQEFTTTSKFERNPWLKLTEHFIEGKGMYPVFQYRKAQFIRAEPADAKYE